MEFRRVLFRSAPYPRGEPQLGTRVHRGSESAWRTEEPSQGHSDGQGETGTGGRRSWSVFEAIFIFPAPMYGTTCWSRKQVKPRATAIRSSKPERTWMLHYSSICSSRAVARRNRSACSASSWQLIGAFWSPPSSGRRSGGRRRDMHFCAMKYSPVEPPCLPLPTRSGGLTERRSE